MKKRALSLILAVFMLLPLASCAVGGGDGGGTDVPGDSAAAEPEYGEPMEELRGIYIATVCNIDYPSSPGLGAEELRRELDDIIDTTLNVGCNAIYFQVRGAADAMYDSKIFPVSEYLTGKLGGELPDGFDPLAYLIERAHACGVDVHAWINPLRVTSSGTATAPKTADMLPENSPARTSPELTVTYAGNIYFNAGEPEARRLIADGVREVVENYDVDGVLFDDYFYPYPVFGAEFDDSAAYEEYGDGEEIADWRRENINKMVESCYRAVKGADEGCAFGIAPGGIWQNDDGENGGSATAGFETYESIYCDPLAWVKGGYIDYLAPQIYWHFGHDQAPYAVIADWWCAALDGTGVGFCISHAAYKYGTDEWRFAEAVGEMTEQLRYARDLMSFGGSIFYGYSAIKSDTEGVAREIADACREPIVYSEPLLSDGYIKIVSPESDHETDKSTVTIRGKSAPGAPVSCNGTPVCRKRDGSFSLSVRLSPGKNIYVFESGEKKVRFVITRRDETQRS